MEPLLLLQDFFYKTWGMHVLAGHTFKAMKLFILCGAKMVYTCPNPKDVRHQEQALM